MSDTKDPIRSPQRAASPAPADPVSSGPRIRAPDHIHLGETVLHRRIWESVTISAPDRQQGPRIQARLVGDPAIRLLQAPLYAHGERSPLTEADKLKLDFKPTQPGITSATLEVDVLDVPHEQL